MEPYVFFALVLDTEKKTQESRGLEDHGIKSVAALSQLVTRCHQMSPDVTSGSQPKNLRIFGSRELGKNRSEELKN